MAQNNASIDVVVCHYNKDCSPALRYMTLHSMAFLCKNRPPGLRIMVVDGSPDEDAALAQGLAELKVEYLHLGKELTFPETYNAGIRKTANPFIVLLANDIFIEADQIVKLAAEIHGEVGCAIPYLSFSDYGTQIIRRIVVPPRCYPSQMTLNVNAFSRGALERIGLIPEQMTGAFNDVILFIKLREANYSIILRNVGYVFHMAKQTLRTGATTVSHEKDALLFMQEFPDYWRNGAILFHKIAQRKITRFLYKALVSLPVSLVNKFNLRSLVWSIEPYICAESGTYREGIIKIFNRQ